MKRRALARGLWAACVLVCLTSCQGPTEIVVRVRSELPEGSIERVKLRVTFPDESVEEEILEELPFLAVIGPAGGSGELLVTATASGPSIQSLTSEARVRFASGKSVLLDLELRDRCLHAPACDSGEACRGCEGCQSIRRPALPSVAHDSVDPREPLVACPMVDPADAGGSETSPSPDGAAGTAETDGSVRPDGGDAQVVSAPRDAGTDADAADATLPDARTDPPDATVSPAADCESRACVRSISMGDTHACFLLTNQRMYCWGEGAEGQLGVGLPMAMDYSIVRVPNFSNWEVVTAEGRNTCGANDEGGVFCWGQFWGILNIEVPQQSQGVANATTVESGTGWACALTSSRAVDCWGYYTGIPAGDVVRVPMPSAGAAWRALPDSLETVYLLDDDDRLWSWLNLELTLEESGVKDAVLVGPRCVLFQDGRLRCEGKNDQGQVGNGAASTGAAAPHVVLVDGVDWRALGGSTDATCAISQVGDVWCWGSNRAGAMGVSPSEQPRVASPRLVAKAPKDDPYVAVEVGLRGVCGLRRSSWVDCWGGEPPEAFGLTPTPLRVP